MPAKCGEDIFKLNFLLINTFICLRERDRVDERARTHTLVRRLKPKIFVSKNHLEAIERYDSLISMWRRSSWTALFSGCFSFLLGMCVRSRVFIRSILRVYGLSTCSNDTTQYVCVSISYKFFDTIYEKSSLLNQQRCIQLIGVTKITTTHTPTIIANFNYSNQNERMCRFGRHREQRITVDWIWPDFHVTRAQLKRNRLDVGCVWEWGRRLIRKLKIQIGTARSKSNEAQIG